MKSLYITTSAFNYIILYVCITFWTDNIIFHLISKVIHYIGSDVILESCVQQQTPNQISTIDKLSEERVGITANRSVEPVESHATVDSSTQADVVTADKQTSAHLIYDDEEDLSVEPQIMVNIVSRCVLMTKWGLGFAL